MIFRLFAGKKLVCMSLLFCLSFCLLPVVYAQRHSGAAAGNHMMPDQGVRDASFSLMRDKTLEAIKRRDRQYMVDLLSPNVLSAIGGESGIKNFLLQWEDLSPKSPFWARFERVLLHGAQWDSESGEFHAPALAFDDSHSELPQAVAWNKNSCLFKSRESPAPLCPLYGQQITLLEPSAALPVKVAWAKVKTGEGKIGFMKSSDFYSASDEFAVFKKVQGRWCLSWFGFAGL